ncbi:hypothetical protein ACFU6S_06345 [Streptomyces sp. NPDC057456]|uniref:hypothetical protein n=1 Tax=Streptomyces sp. NPDC057456 TaxID=3346139 RepID=UPI003682C728
MDSRDARLGQALAVVVDLDRGESPFGWSELPPPPRITRAEIDNALRWDGLRRRAAAGDLWARLQLAVHDVSTLAEEPQ